MSADWSRLKKYPALMLLIATYLIACVVVFGNWYRAQGGAGEQRKKVLRMAHWQLEPGIRDALDWAIGEYEESHPDVEVRQILIPEEGYFRWVNTQLIGGTAPDMIECGLGGAPELWRKFYARYFLPLGEYVDEPNPYNEGTEYAGTPWRLTYFDEMEGGYEEELQTYFRVGLSAFTQRMYYNREMIHEIWPAKQKGTDFPTTFEDFIDVCWKLKARHGEGFVPIAGSQYSFDRIIDTYRTAMTTQYLGPLDLDYDGTVSSMESAGAIYSGRISFLDPGIRYTFELVKEVSNYSPHGATALDRDEAVFLFLQGHAAMIPTGSWDYTSLTEQAEFEIGVTRQNMPLPSKDNPRYGPYVGGQPTEADVRAYFPFAITKTSKYPNVTLDFLQFLSSVAINQELNWRMFWLPAVLAAEPRPELKPFAPRVEGYSQTVALYGPNTQLPFNQELPLYLSGQNSYEQFVERYIGAFRRRLPEGAEDHMRDIQETLDQQLRSAALRRAGINGAIGATDAVTGEPLKQYRRLIEAFGGQLNTRDSEVRIWVQDARRYQHRER